MIVFIFDLHRLTGNQSVRMELAGTVIMVFLQHVSREAGLKKLKSVPEKDPRISGFQARRDVPERCENSDQFVSKFVSALAKLDRDPSIRSTLIRELIRRMF
jgi:hypothetical protein